MSVRAGADTSALNSMPQDMGAAIADLDRAVATGLDPRLLDDAAFASLRSDPRFVQLGDD